LIASPQMRRARGADQNWRKQAGELPLDTASNFAIILTL